MAFDICFQLVVTNHSTCSGKYFNSTAKVLHIAGLTFTHFFCYAFLLVFSEAELISRNASLDIPNGVLIGSSFSVQLFTKVQERNGSIWIDSRDKVVNILRHTLPVKRVLAAC